MTLFKICYDLPAYRYYNQVDRIQFAAYGVSSKTVACPLPKMPRHILLEQRFIHAWAAGLQTAGATRTPESFTYLKAITFVELPREQEEKKQRDGPLLGRDPFQSTMRLQNSAPSDVGPPPVTHEFYQPPHPISFLIRCRIHGFLGPCLIGATGCDVYDAQGILPRT